MHHNSHCPLQVEPSWTCLILGVRCSPGPTLTSYHWLRLKVLSFRCIFNFSPSEMSYKVIIMTISILELE